MHILPFTGELLDRVVTLLQQTLHADPISRSLFVRKVLIDPNFDPEGALVAMAEGQVVGFALGIARRLPLEDAPPDGDRGYITLLAVHPHWQRRGIGSQLLQRVESYLRSRDRKVVLVSPYAPNYFTPGVDVSAYPDGLRFFLQRGYQEVYRPIAMDCNLLNLSTPEWVQQREQQLQQEGVTVEPYRPHLILPLFRFLREEFPGDWQRFVREAIARIEQGDSPERVWIAHERGEVVGFSHFEGERFGPIGVAQSQRGRGIGQVLMFKTLQSMRLQGLHTAFFLWSDDRTAERLYHTAGFVETRRFALLRKEL
ncbi:MAG: GNAT family N-acetyltransferase [bacterium]|nr:GNAT family N-acetyltransferase [bacterium]